MDSSIQASLAQSASILMDMMLNLAMSGPADSLSIADDVFRFEGKRSTAELSRESMHLSLIRNNDGATLYCTSAPTATPTQLLEQADEYAEELMREIRQALSRAQQDQRNEVLNLHRKTTKMNAEGGDD